MKNLALGRYVPYNSFIHRLDPRTKLFAMVVLMVSIFFRFSSVAMNFTVYGILLILIYILMRVTHIKLLSLFRSLKAMWFMILFLLVVNCIMPGTGDYFKIFELRIYFSAIYNTLYIILRLVMMIALTMILTTSTKPLDLTNGLEWVMTPLKAIRFPVHEVAMTISLALRFIPTLLEETQRLMQAQASRGVDFAEGKFKEKVRAIISLIIPLFISAFQRSDELANAMEARGYDPTKKRTRYRVMHFAAKDYLSMLFITLIMGGLIYLMVSGFDIYQVLGIL